jgi:type III restriction enzyme
MSFFERPILNSPYAPPARCWELDGEGRPTDRVIEARRKSALWTALPGASAKSERNGGGAQTRMMFDGDGLSTEATEFNPSPIVNDLREELATWRALPNATQWKVTPVTERLLRHWRAIQADETQQVRPFFCQLEAVEAAIWLA